MIDYTFYYKYRLEGVGELAASSAYDVFLSVFNDSERVKAVFDAIQAQECHWLVLPEYQYAAAELPTAVGNTRCFSFLEGASEAEIIRGYFEKSGVRSNINMCIDITGFIRPHLVFLIRFLQTIGFKKIDLIYTDPDTYVKKENTSFTQDYVEVRSVNGCEGHHITDTSNDLLIIGSGYDDKRIADVSKSKANARKAQVFGFPSLQPDMYQENVLKAYRAEESSTGGERNFIDSNTSIFAPANDPFVTAQSISEFVRNQSKKKIITNLYLSPLSTKAQTLGFVLYYIYECLDKPVSIIFPYSSSYSRETTKGISKIWKYVVEL